MSMKRISELLLKILGFLWKALRFLWNRKFKLAVLVALFVFSQFMFYKADNYKVSSDSEYVQYELAVQNYNSITSRDRYLVNQYFVDRLLQTINAFTVITNTPPLDSKVDAFSNFGIGTIIAKYFATERLSSGQNISDILLAARAYIMEALRDFDDREFTWNLEIINGRVKEELMEEGYSEEEAKRIILNGRGSEEAPPPEDDPLNGGDPSDNEPATDF